MLWETIKSSISAKWLKVSVEVNNSFIGISYWILSKTDVKVKDAFMLMEATLVWSDAHYFTLAHLCMLSDIEML